MKKKNRGQGHGRVRVPLKYTLLQKPSVTQARAAQTMLIFSRLAMWMTEFSVIMAYIGPASRLAFVTVIYNSQTIATLG
jgi:hypothetical protein